MGWKRCLLLGCLVLAAACGSTPLGNREPAQRVATTRPASTSSTTGVTAAGAGTTTSVAAVPSTTVASVPASTTTTLQDPDPEGGSRDLPVALGSPAVVGDWYVRVVAVDHDASTAVAAASEFNEPAAPGHQYVLIDLEATYAGTASASFWLDATWAAVGESAVAYDAFGASCGTIDGDLAYLGEVWPGGTAVGSVCFEVETGDVDDLQLILDGSFGSTGRTFFALQPDRGVVLDVEIPPVPPVDTSGPAGTRGNPIEIGSVAALDEWYVQVDGVTPDATEVVVNAGIFNEPPGPGRQYLLADVSVAYFGEEEGVSAGSLQFQLLGPDSVAVDTFGASCGYLAGDIATAGDLFPGGRLSGTVCFEVPAGDGAGSVLVVDAFGFASDRAFFALTPGLGAASPVTVPAPPAVTPGPEGTWGNPFRRGSRVKVGDWQVGVTDVLANGTAAVLAENEFNDPPRDGRQFVLIGLEGSYEGSISGTLWSELTWSLLGSGRVAYNEFNNSCGNIPDDLSFAPEVFPGGSVTGNICLEVPSTQVGELVLILEDFIDFDERVFVAVG